MDISENTIVFRLGSKNEFNNLDVKKNIRNFIADLSGVNLEVIEKLKDKFITFAKTTSYSKGSFVIVCECSFDENLIIVPTLQEAYDYIEMEEIERQLEL